MQVNVIAGIYVSNHEQARLLQEVLQRELMERAGSVDEPLLARWHNEVTAIRNKASRHQWGGWTP